MLMCIKTLKLADYPSAPQYMSEFVCICRVRTHMASLMLAGWQNFSRYYSSYGQASALYVKSVISTQDFWKYASWNQGCILTVTNGWQVSSRGWWHFNSKHLNSQPRYYYCFFFFFPLQSRKQKSKLAQSLHIIAGWRLVLWIIAFSHWFLFYFLLFFTVLCVLQYQSKWGISRQFHGVKSGERDNLLYYT